jgi:hypothetical protein
MTAELVSVLLGRPLTSTETTNFNTYLDLATGRVSDLICSDISPATEELRTFQLRNGYRTLNTPIFDEIQSITINDTELDEADYTVKQGSDFNGDWFNSIVFKTTHNFENVEITADWGFSSIPLDLQKVIAEQFGIFSTSIDADQIYRKQVEDFSIQLNGTKSDAFDKKYAATIAKYSSCTELNIQSGYVGWSHGRFYSI